MRNTLLFAVKALTSCRLFQNLLAAAAYPNGLVFQSLWVCLMVDREAIESMLRVYGPPAVEIFAMGGPARRQDVPYLPYLTAVSTRWDEETEDEESEASGEEENDDKVKEEPADDGEYHGDLKFALKSILVLWQNEQTLSPDEYYQRDRSICADIGFRYEPPAGIR